MTDSTRLTSVDALRGCTVAAMLLVNDAGDWNHVYPWLEHAEWNGCTPADFIFPFFMLIVGVSISLALQPKLEQASNRWVLTCTVLIRGLRIFMLGIALHAVATVLIPGREFRLLGVLQRIGVCYAIVACVTIWLRPVLWQWLLGLTVLLAYWCLLVLLPFGASLLPGANIVDHVDTFLLGRLAYEFNPVTGQAHDPEGILSTLPALISVWFGTRIGAWLRAGLRANLLTFGAVAIVLGWAWSWVLPFNKQLWTPSFVLWTAGWASLAIWFMHEWVDKRGHQAWGLSFGMNAIAIYAGAWIAVCVLEASGLMHRWYPAVFEASLGTWLGPEQASLGFALCFTGVFALLAWIARQRGWRISI